MPELDFQIENVEAVPYAAAPTLAFKLQVSNALESEQIHSILLHTQIQIETNRRRYSSGDEVRLHDLFGERERRGQTMHSMLWTLTNITVPSFSGSTCVDLPVPCTFDFNVAAAKYFYALEDGQVPLTLLFSGTVFYEAEQGGLHVAQIPWEKEAPYAFPVQTWKNVMDLYYPNSAWLCLQRDVFDQLYQYKIRYGIPTWEQALQKLLAGEEQGRKT